MRGTRIKVHLPKKPQPVTLADLKEELAAITSVPYEAMAVFTTTQMMHDDAAPLSSYSLQDGDIITLVGQPSKRPRTSSSPPPFLPQVIRPTAEFEAQQAAAAGRKAAEADTSEEGLSRRIDGAQRVAQVDLAPEVEQLERSIALIQTEGLDSLIARQDVPPTATNLTGPNAVETTKGILNAHQIVLEQKKLSELLLRQLLSLDNIQVETQALRIKRKAAVKQVQLMLDRVDAAWTQAKSLGVKASM